jgi:3-oxoacyl-[acyl-carrier-protein] synthase II
VAAKITGQFEAMAPQGSAPVTVLSAATGVAQATREEREVLGGLIKSGRVDTVRATGSMLGTATSATFPATAGLAALALSRGGFYRPFDATGFETPFTSAPTRIVVTAAGMWRGEGSALIAAVD